MIDPYAACDGSVNAGVAGHAQSSSGRQREARCARVTPSN